MGGKGSTTVYTSSDVSCDSYDGTLNACLSKGDKVFLFNNAFTADAAMGDNFPAGLAKGSESNGNMYEVVKVGTSPMSALTPTLEDPLSQKVGLQMVVKFDVTDATSYEYVSECSGRGLCNGDSGLCECFAGYTNDNCDLQSALAA